MVHQRNEIGLPDLRQSSGDALQLSLNFSELSESREKGLLTKTPDPLLFSGEHHSNLPSHHKEPLARVVPELPTKKFEEDIVTTESSPVSPRPTPSFRKQKERFLRNIDEVTTNPSLYREMSPSEEGKAPSPKRPARTHRAAKASSNASKESCLALQGAQSMASCGLRSSMKALDDWSNLRLPAIQRINPNQLNGQMAPPHNAFAPKKPLRRVACEEPSAGKFP